VVQISKLDSLQNQLFQLWASHGGKNDSARLMVMKHRAVEVLSEVAR
jgi:hypothetical protein